MWQSESEVEVKERSVGLTFEGSYGSPFLPSSFEPFVFSGALP